MVLPGHCEKILEMSNFSPWREGGLGKGSWYWSPTPPNMRMNEVQATFRILTRPNLVSRRLKVRPRGDQPLGASLMSLTLLESFVSKLSPSPNLLSLSYSLISYLQQVDSYFENLGISFSCIFKFSLYIGYFHYVTFH